jgi:hypothetical protein
VKLAQTQLVQEEQQVLKLQVLQQVVQELG